jgi:hypothetical protein
MRLWQSLSERVPTLMVLADAADEPESGVNREDVYPQTRNTCFAERG